MLPIYESIADRILAPINSIHLKLVILFFLISERFDYKSEEHKRHVNEIFMKVYISYTSFVTLLMIGRLIANFILFLCLLCLTSKQKEARASRNQILKMTPVVSPKVDASSVANMTKETYGEFN